jgi:hypothetical protein
MTFLPEQAWGVVRKISLAANILRIERLLCMAKNIALFDLDKCCKNA